MKREQKERKERLGEANFYQKPTHSACAISFLKGLCHEDIAVLGQFCADVISQCPNPYIKCSSRDIKKLSNKSPKGALTIIFFQRILQAMHKKLAQLFSSFNPFPSMPSVATDNRKAFQCLNNKTGSLFLKLN